jgi:hypothetical protein
MRPAIRSHRVVRLMAACSSVWFPPASALPGAGSAAVGGADKQALPAALNLSDEEFFAEKVSPTLTAALLDSRFVGVALRAPGRVDVRRRSTLPLLIASRFDGARDWELPFHDHAWLVGVDRRSGKVSLASAFGGAKTPAPVSRQEKPSGDELRSHGAQVNLVDGRSRLGVPWQPGCWSLNLVYHDWMANPVVIRLEKADDGPANGPANGPTDGPTNGQNSEACAPPSTAKTQISFRRRRSPDGAVRVSGRYTVPVDALGEDRTALPVSLLIVTRDGASPERADWRIPVKVRPGTNHVSGVIDHALPAVGKPARGAVAYLVVAGQVHGPRPWTTTYNDMR